MRPHYPLLTIATVSDLSTDTILDPHTVSRSGFITAWLITATTWSPGLVTETISDPDPDSVLDLDSGSAMGKGRGTGACWFNHSYRYMPGFIHSPLCKPWVSFGVLSDPGLAIALVLELELDTVLESSRDIILELDGLRSRCGLGVEYTPRLVLHKMTCGPTGACMVLTRLTTGMASSEKTPGGDGSHERVWILLSQTIWR